MGIGSTKRRVVTRNRPLGALQLLVLRACSDGALTAAAIRSGYVPTINQSFLQNTLRRFAALEFIRRWRDETQKQYVHLITQDGRRYLKQNTLPPEERAARTMREVAAAIKREERKVLRERDAKLGVVRGT